MPNLNATVFGSSVPSEDRAARLSEFDRALATIDRDIALATTLRFPGGSVEIKKPTTEQLVASALDWQKMAEEDAADLDKPGALGEFERTILAARLQRHLAKARAALQEIVR